MDGNKRKKLIESAWAEIGYAKANQGSPEVALALAQIAIATAIVVVAELLSEFQSEGFNVSTREELTPQQIWNHD